MKQNKGFKKILFLLICTTFLLFISPLVFSSLLPRSLLEQPVQTLLAGYLKRQGISLKWEKVDVKTDSKALNRKKIRLSFTDICLAKKPQLENLCFKKASFVIDFKIGVKGLSIIEAGPLIMEGGSLAWRLVKNDKSENASFTTPVITIPSFLKNALFFPARIDLSEIQIFDQDRTFKGRASVALVPAEKNGIEKIQFDLKAIAPGYLNVSTQGVITSTSLFLKDQWHLETAVDISQPQGGHAVVNAMIAKNEKNGLRFNVQTNGIEKQAVFKGSLLGFLTENELQADVAFTGKLPKKGLQINDSACRIISARHVLPTEKSKTTTNCSGHFVTNSLQKSKTAALSLNKLDLPFSLDATIDGFFITASPKIIQGDIVFNVMPASNNFLVVSADSQTHFSGKINDPLDLWKISTLFKINLNSNRFEAVAASLKNINLSLPAPLNVLRGNTKISLTGNLTGLNSGGLLRAEAALNLTSKKQRFHLTGTGDLGLSFTQGMPVVKSLFVNVTLNEVALELPHLNPFNFPALIIDQRIKKTSIRPGIDQGKTVSFPYHIVVRTNPQTPVKIYTHLIKQPVPFAINMDLQNTAVNGIASIEPFEFTLFKRKARIKKMALKFKEPFKESPVKGIINIDDSDYAILLSISGTAEKPVINLESSPFLSREDIIAVLLYGEPYNDLDVDRSDSAGNFNAALADRAIALSSFLVLGSTPIQRLGYDPNTKTYSAKIRLGNKTSLKVGTSGKQHTATIRKRLGKGWGISTSVDNDADSKDIEATTLFEWQKRY
ncbi:translocation/assembly module TamB [bacterium]|nr:translocation/assembly module TamB [bacterium]